MERVAIVFDDFGKAMDAHMKMFELVREKGFVSLRDFNNLVTETDNIFEDDMYDTYGWSYLCGVEVEAYHGDKWIIMMPEMINISEKEKEKK